MFVIEFINRININFNFVYITFFLFLAIFYFRFIIKNQMKKKNIEENSKKINFINKISKIDNEYYSIFYNVYKMIGSTININKTEIFDEMYLLKLNEAKNIFYEVKRNKKLVKSGYLLFKIFKKINLYDIDKSEIDSTIIYLILLVLNKKK
jgi:hypothetical protein